MRTGHGTLTPELARSSSVGTTFACMSNPQVAATVRFFGEGRGKTWRIGESTRSVLERQLAAIGLSRRSVVIHTRRRECRRSKQASPKPKAGGGKKILLGRSYWTGLSSIFAANRKPNRSVFCRQSALHDRLMPSNVWSITWNKRESRSIKRRELGYASSSGFDYRRRLATSTCCRRL